MADLKKLAEHRKDILLAEVVAWLHDIGKLDPNFLVMQTGESPDVLKRYRIPGQYTFKRFCKPSVLLSPFPYEDLKGPLYFLQIRIGKEIEGLEQKIRDIQERLNERSLSDKERRHLAERLNEYHKRVQELRRKKRESENALWKEYEKTIEECRLFQKWTLGSLLTMFWESDWFTRSESNNTLYEPGSDKDPDYQRTPKSEVKIQTGLTMELPALLLLAHGEISGQEKKGFSPDGQYVDVSSYEEIPKRELARLRLSSAFGHETELPWKDWVHQRQKIFDEILGSWSIPLLLKNKLQEVLSSIHQAVGDTQRPINEISLWDYSAATAALFKSAIAQAMLLGRVPTPATMRWRLLAVRMDTIDFLFQVQNVADLVARKRLLDTSYRLIEHLFAVEFPIGSPVYQDENGIVFVIPELPGYEDIKLKQEFESLVYKALKEPNVLETLTETIFLHGAEDIRPIVQITPPRRGKKLNLVEALSEPSTSAPDPREVKSWWTDKTEEKCIVCGLRPEGYVEPGLPPFVTKQKAKERHLCGVCLARRGRRSEEWATQEPGRTIWVGEVADINARITLIVGRFALNDWLSGKLVRSMTIGTDKFGNWLAKPPTFARIHRIWRTTFEFWQESLTQIRDSLTDDRRRLRLYLDSPPDLGAYHVYELDLGVTSVSVVWVPPNEKQQGYLLSIENLGYIAKQLGKKKDVYPYPDLAAISVEEHIQKQLPWDAVLRNPEAHAEVRSENLIKGHKIINVDYQDVSYATIIPILAEPRTFMALVPADKAVDVVQAIRTKYEREMGKVRNRLPLHLGVVFADAHTPLRAILDAGRRMLKQKAIGKVGKWEIAEDVTEQSGALLAKAADLAQGTQQFDKWYAVKLKHGGTGRALTWYVPAVMGDGSTEDNWYPYVFLAREDEPTDRNRYFSAPNPWNASHKWLVHAGDLQKGDIIYFTPATLDFQWLDSSASRFEIAYGKNGQRQGNLSRRPYLLDELDTLERIWNTLSKHLTTSQIHALISLIESRREDWEVSPHDDTFHAFCRNALANAKWQTRPWERAGKAREDWLEEWGNYAALGWITDAVEIWMKIMKEKPVADKMQGGNA